MVNLRDAWRTAGTSDDIIPVLPLRTIEAEQKGNQVAAAAGRVWGRRRRH